MTRLRNVFSIVPDCHAPAGHYVKLWQNHFYDGLADVVEKLFVPEGVDFSWARSSSGDRPASRAKTSEQLWAQIKAARDASGVDAIVSYCFAGDVELELVQRVIQLGVPWVNFYCDSTHRFADIEALARVVSLNWFPEHAAIGRYARAGANWLCRPYAYNPKCLPDLSGCEARRAGAFVGLPTANRITQLGLLRLFGCEVGIRGPGWVEEGYNPFHNASPHRQPPWRALLQPHLTERILRRAFWPRVRKEAGGALNEQEFFEFISTSLVVLGLNQCRDESGRLISYMKFRDLEFPGYGCCYLTEHNQDMAAALNIGEEVLTCAGMLDAAGQLRELQAQPDRAKAIGRAARRRVLAEHSWAARVRELEARL